MINPEALLRLISDMATQLYAAEELLKEKDARIAALESQPDTDPGD